MLITLIGVGVATYLAVIQIQPIVEVCLYCSVKISSIILFCHHSDNNGRLLLLNLEIDKQEFTIVNVYAPNEMQDRISFFKYMKSVVDTHAVNKNRLIIAGDFNCVLSENDGITRKIDKSTDILEHTIVQLNVIDIWRFLNPNTTEFTYIDPSCNMRIVALICYYALMLLNQNVLRVL